MLEPNDIHYFQRIDKGTLNDLREIDISPIEPAFNFIIYWRNIFYDFYSKIFDYNFDISFYSCCYNRFLYEEKR